MACRSSWAYSSPGSKPGEKTWLASLPVPSIPNWSSANAASRMPSRGRRRMRRCLSFFRKWTPRWSAWKTARTASARSATDSIEKNRLLADPLVCFCLDHLTTAQRRRLEEDLELAARVQKNLLPPRDVRAAGWQAHYYYEPLGPVSGDYCDVIASENGTENLLFLLGDVSGKGVAASLLMTHLHAMFRSLTSVGLSVEQMMHRANRLFCESTVADQFATLVCGRASRSGDVEISSAGHCPVLAVRSGSVSHFESTGIPLGMFSNAEYAVHRTRLRTSGFPVSIHRRRLRDARRCGIGIWRGSRGRVCSSPAGAFS